MKHPTFRRFGVTVAVGTLALAAACGSGASSGSDTSKAASISVSEQDVQSYLQPDKTLPVSKPVASPIPGGLNVVFIRLAFSQSVSLLNGLKDAAAVLGWRVTDLVWDVTNPASLSTSFQSAIAQKPDAIVVLGATTDQYAAFIPQARAANISIISTYSPDSPQPGVTPVLTPESEYPYHAQILTDTLLLDAKKAGDTPHVLQLRIPAQDNYTKWINDGVVNELKAKCSGCTRDELDIEQADLFNGQYTQQVVSYLQRHPAIKYIIANGGQTANGLPEALAAAGLNDVKIYGVTATDVQIKKLADGSPGAWTVQPFRVGGWIVADQIARVKTGDATDLWSNEHMGYVVTSQNASQLQNPADPAFPADYQQQFKRLWGKATS